MIFCAYFPELSVKMLDLTRLVPSGGVTLARLDMGSILLLGLRLGVRRMQSEEMWILTKNTRHI